MTIAVEAASEKLRQIIHKPLKDADLFATVEPEGPLPPLDVEFDPTSFTMRMVSR